MKLLVFAHVPPPHHGQSYMVKLMLDGFGGDARRRAKSDGSGPELKIECYHVNARLSFDLEDIGSFHTSKVLLLLGYCLQAIWCRFRYGVKAFYYVPAPGKRAALYRDWIVMLLCRPFFPHLIHHWHAVGLGDWLQKEGTWVERWLTHRLLGRSELGIALAIPNMRDPLWFRSRDVTTVPNGIPDPCPVFDRAILPRRKSRCATRRRLLAGEAISEDERHEAAGDPGICHVLFLAHCTREKGLFDTIDGVLVANQTLRARGVGLQFHLTVAGAFLNPEEDEEFRSRMQTEPAILHYAGFVRDSAKADLLATSDVFCFPTYYSAEGQPVNLIEAISYGLPLVTTRWRAIPEVLPPDYPGFVPPQSPEAIAAALVAAASEEGSTLRGHFLARYTLGNYLRELRTQLQTVESPSIPQVFSAAAAR
jgi:glycosyltransferase involved in cell wall biosynthesis